MKNTIQYVLLCFCAFSLLTLNSCKENSGCTDPLSINYDALAEEDDGSCKRPQLTLNLNSTISVDDTTNTPFVLGEIYQINGLDVRIDLLTFYVTGVTLNKDSMDSYVLSNPGLLQLIAATDTTIATNSTSLDMGELEAGYEVSNTSFNVGVSPDLNNADPSLLPASNPLSGDHPDIQHWSWTAGYIFLKVEGFVDVNQDGTFEMSNDTEYMSLHCGFNENLASIPALNTPDDIDETTHRVDINFDINQLFDGYDLASQLFSRPSANPAYAEQLMDNVPAAFYIVE